MSDLLQLIRQHHNAYQKRGWRLPIWLAGSNTYTEQQLADLDPTDSAYWLGPKAPAGFSLLSAKQKQQWLGTECDLLVVDAREAVDWDLVAASSGCVKAGGIWLFVSSQAELWQQQPNPAAKRVLPYPLDAATYTGLFKQFWLKQLQHAQWLRLVEASPVMPPVVPDAIPPVLAEPPYRTVEQQQAVAAIHKVVTGHRRRPLVLTAHRGRGKSSALGLAAAQLVQHGKTDILLTGPSPSSVQTAFFVAAQLLHENYQAGKNQLKNGAIRFVPVDVLLAEKQQNTVILVDEAAAIPTPQLQQLVDSYSRLVFATTEHGYEGTGRGFQLRFQHYLQQQCPDFKKLHLHQPIRYQSDDPLEQLIFQGFMLEYAENPVIDSEMISAASLPTPPQLRVQGHLLAQSLAFHCLQPDLAEKTMARIQRIVVHPSLQSKGLGSHLLTRVLQDLLTKNFLVGTSFGATRALAKFWQKAGFLPVKLSQQQEQASNEPSVLMLYGEQFRPLQQLFSRQLYWQLADKQRTLDPMLALAWAEAPAIALLPQQIAELKLFQAGLRPFDLIETHLLCWFNLYHTTVASETALLLVQRLWQKHEWTQLSVPDAKQALSELCKHLSL